PCAEVQLSGDGGSRPGDVLRTLASGAARPETPPPPFRRLRVSLDHPPKPVLFEYPDEVHLVLGEWAPASAPRLAVEEGRAAGQLGWLLFHPFSFAGPGSGLVSGMPCTKHASMVTDFACGLI